MNIRSIYTKINNRLSGSKTLITNDIKAIPLINIESCKQDSDDTAFIRCKDGMIFYSYLPDSTELSLYNKHRHELPSTLKPECFRVALDIIQRYFRENSVHPIPHKCQSLGPGYGFIDGGAYIGFGAIKASKKVGNNGTVIAIEAHPDSFRLLKKNIEKNEVKNTYIFNAALQKLDSMTNLYFENRQQTSIFKNIHDDITKSDISYQNVVEVQGRSIDSIIKEVGYLSNLNKTVLSLEINGAELDALRGMRELMTNCNSIELRIAARYSSKENDFKQRMVNELKQYEKINIVDIPPYVYAFK